MCSAKDIPYQWDNNKETKPNVFKRYGSMAAAIVFKVMENKERSERDWLDIYAEASNGQMPNLDLVYTVHYLAVHRQGLRVVIRTLGSLLDSTWLKIIGNVMQGLSKLLKSVNPKWKFETTSTEFIEGTATVASSIFHQAFEVPTGSHCAFRDYQVDAITLELSPRTYLDDEDAQSVFLLRSGRRNTEQALILRLTVLARNLAFGIVGFSPFGLMMLRLLCDGFGGVSIGGFWDWAEFLWSWNSATYLYVTLVHLPCWVLCMHILMHR